MTIKTYPPGYDTGEEQVTLSDLSAHMLKLKEVVEGMEHGAECNAHPSAKYFASKRPDSEFKKDTCNCPRGDLLREIGEVLG